MDEKQKKSKNIHRRNKVRPPDLADWEVPEPTLSQNPTDRNLYIHSTYAGPAGPPENPFENEVLHFRENGTHTDAWQENVVKNATVLKAIRLYELAHLLALEDEYEDILPDLWKYCGFNDDPMNRFPKWDQKMIEKPHSRARVWYWILSRWTTYRYFKNKKCEDIKSFYFHGLKSNVPRMPLYNYFNEFEKVAEDMPQSCEQYIKLDDFLYYLLILQKSYFNNDIKIPLPECLFPKKIVTGKERRINIDEIIEDARRNKYIALGLLPSIMAADEQYSKDLLVELWKKYQCDRRGSKEPLVETYGNRVGTWYHLFERLAFGRVQGVPIKKSSPLYLPLYYFNDKEGALEKYDRTKNPGDPQVELKDLKEYFTETIGIPVPQCLFLDAHTSDDEFNNLEVKKRKIIPCTPGTKWEDIRITLIANDTVRIKTPEGEERFTYHELGLSDKRKGDSPKILWPLLVQFAKNRGELNAIENKSEGYLPDQAKRLNNHLKDLFGIPDSIYKGHYKKYRGYKTKIQFFDDTQTPIERPTSKSVQEEIVDEFEDIQNKYLN